MTDNVSTPTAAHKHERSWWKEAVIYQVYPASFRDTNGDGVGDIPGVIEKIPYLASLGVGCVWLSPHYASPQVDMGYDISNYEDIYPPYGNIEQIEKLIEQCHAHGIKIIFDLVINHTSDQHAWFKESRSSTNNPKRDWYIWKPPRGWKDGKPLPPNNWGGIFGGSAWEFDQTTQEYYLHLFVTEMPDLNWENPVTRKAIYESSMHFWLKRGVDGFRVDVVNKYSKNQSFPDAPIVKRDQYEQPCSKINSNGPRMHEFLSEMHEVLSQYRTQDGGEIMTVGELPSTPLEADVRAYVSASRKELSMVFNFEAISLGHVPGNRSELLSFTVEELKQRLLQWQVFVNGTDSWTTVFMENHDQGRSISRFGNDTTEVMRVRSGKLLATVLATMTGTLFLYQGQEIGMTNMPRSWDWAEYKDVWTQNAYREAKERGASAAELDRCLDGQQKCARDHARTPVQWNSSAHAGFCTDDVDPWMRVNDNYVTINVETEEQSKDGVLAYWKEMLQLRARYKDACVYGTFTLLNTTGNVFAFEKEGDNGTKITMVANMGDEGAPWSSSTTSLLLSNVSTEHKGQDEDELQPWEARVYID